MLETLKLQKLKSKLFFIFAEGISNSEYILKEFLLYKEELTSRRRHLAEYSLIEDPQEKIIFHNIYQFERSRRLLRRKEEPDTKDVKEARGKL